MAKATHVPLAVTQLEDRLVPSWFLKFDSVRGEAPETSLHGRIEIESWSFGPSANEANPSVHSPGKLAVHDIVITRFTDSASNMLFQKCLTGKHMPKVQLEFYKSDSDPKPYLDFVLKGAFVSGYSMSSGGDRPTESLDMNYGKLQVQYHKQKSDEKNNDGNPKGDGGGGACSNGQAPPAWACVLESSLSGGWRARHRIVQNLLASPECVQALANCAYEPVLPRPGC